MIKGQTQSLLIIVNQEHRGVDFQIRSYSKQLIHDVNCAVQPNTQEADWATNPQSEVHASTPGSPDTTRAELVKCFTVFCVNLVY